MSEFRNAHKALLSRILDGDGKASRKDRQNAFDNGDLDEPIKTLVGKVALQAHSVTDEDIAAARASGLSEDQIFEIVISAAIGQSTRQYNSAHAALAAATGTE